MNNQDKILIFAYYSDGAIQSWGYDVDQFASYDDLFADVAHDFTTQLSNVTKIRFMYNGSETKDLIPTIFGKELVDDLTAWLQEIGAYQNGN